MSEEKDIQQIDREVSEAQLEKLNLEIEELKNKKEKKILSEKITPYIGLISVVIAVGGFLFGVYQFLDGQEKNRLSQERELSEKIENHLSSDIEKILLFTQNEKMSVAHMTYLFEDLRTYIKLKAKTTKNPDEEIHELTRAISIKLLYAVQNDCNFENHKDVSFLWAILSNWEDFADALKENEGMNVAILDRQSDALDIFYSKDSNIVSTITYDAAGGIFTYPHGFGKLTRRDTEHLQNILNNIKNALNLLTDEKDKKLIVLDVQGGTCNRTLTKQILGMDYEPKDYDELRSCVK
jgi:CRISPR/Cas system CMR-associated protein Cmr5 small subunit